MLVHEHHKHSKVCAAAVAASIRLAKERDGCPSEIKAVKQALILLDSVDIDELCYIHTANFEGFEGGS